MNDQLWFSGSPTSWSMPTLTCLSLRDMESGPVLSGCAGAEPYCKMSPQPIMDLFAVLAPHAHDLNVWFILLWSVHEHPPVSVSCDLLFKTMDLHGDLPLFQAILQRFREGILDLKKTHDVKGPWSRVNSFICVDKLSGPWHTLRHLLLYLCIDWDWELNWGCKNYSDGNVRAFSSLPLQNEFFHCGFLHSACPSCG